MKSITIPKTQTYYLQITDREITVNAGVLATVTISAPIPYSINNKPTLVLQPAQSVTLKLNSKNWEISSGSTEANTIPNLVSGYFLTNNGVRLLWSRIVTGVSSVFGRTGDVVSASGDYTASQITNVPAGDIVATTVQAAIDELDTEKQAISGKDASNGYVGLTLLKINFKNVLNTFTSFFTNSNTAARTYTFPDKDGTVAMTSDIPTVTPSALSKTDDTNVTLTLGGTPLTSLLQAVSLTLGWTGILSIVRGGTNSNAALSNNRVMQSSGGAIVEAAAITASRALESDANGIPVASATTATQLSYCDFTSSGQTQLDAITSEQWTEIVMTGGDQTTTSASGQDITELVSGTLSANTRYYFKGVIRTACNNTGGVKFAVTVPAGTTFVCFFTGRLAGSAATANMGSVATAASGTLSGQALNTFSGSAAVYVSVEFTTSATTGVAQFQFASGVAGQTSTIHQDGTLLEYKEIP
jgi:hypothetical protein